MEVSQHEVVLSNEQREHFERDGYLILDSSGLPEGMIDAIIKDVEPLYNPPGQPERVDKNGVRAVGPRVQEAWRASDNAKALAIAPRVLGALEELYGRKPQPFQTLNFRVGSQQLPHSDAFHFNSVPSGFMCGAWVALEDIDMENGPVMYFPGSHKLKEATWHDVGMDAKVSDFPSQLEYMTERRAAYERYVEKIVDENNYRDPEYALLRKGQVLIWASNLLHGGSPQKDPSRTRHSQVTHYFFEGVRSFNPMREVPGEQKYWTYPIVITEDRPQQLTPQLIRSTIETHTEEGAIVLVASNGDAAVLDLEGREGWHFPRSEDGTFGERLDSSDTAIAMLEDLRSKGARYLVWPGYTIHWITEEYGQFQEHLENQYKTVLRDRGSCVIFDLEDQR
jgi:Phytanoyl-CoA dioxygenase (PhyH)